MDPAPLALLWDVDGTLAETELNGHRVAFNEAFRAAELPWHWDEATYLQLLQVSGGRERLSGWLTTMEGQAPDAARLDALVRCKQACYSALVRRGALPLRDGVADLIREAAAAGLAQVIVTTSSRAAVQGLVEGSLGTLAEAFSFWVCGDDVAAKKPDPQGYRLAVERLGLPPQQLLVLEDSANGVAAAEAAGLPCLLTLSSLSRHEPAESLAAARAVVEGLATADGGGMVQVHRGPLCPQPRITLAWLQELCAGP